MHTNIKIKDKKTLTIRDISSGDESFEVTKIKRAFISAVSGGGPAAPVS